MSTPAPTTTRRWKQGAAIGTGVALLAGVVAIQAGPTGSSASSHREAPLIAGDPRADNTDVYAFVSPDDPDTVTIIANWLPFEEPNGGPNFYPWADGSIDDPLTAEDEDDGARYTIKIDNDGNAVADLTYEWLFETVVKPGGDDTFLVNTGPFTSVDDDTLLRYQTYDLNVVTDPNQTPADPSDDLRTTLMSDVIAAPSVAGATSTPDYQALVDEAVASGTMAVPGGELKSYAGQADDPFFLDLRVFDLLYGADASEVGEDTLAGYNVNTIALQVPKDVLALNASSDDNPVVGIWSTTDRARLQENDNGTPLVDADDFVESVFGQVSRLGNPLVNEVVFPLALKDAFNSISPDVDATIPEAVDAVINPILPPLVEAVYGVPAPEGDRSDLVEIFLQGISVENDGLSGDPDENPALKADLNSLALNADVASIVPSEMLRLNMAVPPTADPNPAGVIGGDFQGFPNGRRLADDILDSAFQVAEGIVFEDGRDLSALAVVDSVDRNDREFADTFPYVALPHIDSVTNGTERTPRAPEFVAIDPTRVLETRSTVPGGQIGYSGAKPAAESTIDVDVSNVVPDDATAVFISVSAVNPDVNGYVTVFADCDDDHPFAASLNPLAGTNVSNLVAAELDDEGSLCVYTSGSTHLIVDVVGYQPSTSSFTPNDPERLLETRAGVAGGQIGFAGERPDAGDTIVVDVTGTAGAALPDDTEAVVLNVTSINPEGVGFVTVYPCGSDRPTTANLNISASGDVRGNLAVSQVGSDGTVCLYLSAGTDLTVDLQGSYPASTSFVSVVPERLLETRDVATGRIAHTGDKPVAGEVLELDVIGVGDNPAPEGTGTVFLNIAAIQAEAEGYITVWACGEAMPGTANGVYGPGANTSTLVAAPVGDGGRVCIFTSAAAHLTADIAGFFPGTQLVG